MQNEETPAEGIPSEPATESTADNNPVAEGPVAGSVIDPTSPAEAKAPKSKLPKKKLVVVIAVLVLLLGGGAAAFFAARPNKQAASNQPAPAKQTTEIPAIDRCSTSDGTVLTANWTGKRQKLPNVKILDPPKADEVDSDHPEKVDVNKYVASYKIGTTSKGQDVILFTKFEGYVNGETTGIAIESSPDHYSVLLKNTLGLLDSSYLQPNVTTDDDQFFPELCVLTLQYKGLTLKDDYTGLGSSGTQYDDSKSKKKELQVTDSGTLYELTYKDHVEYAMTTYILKRKDTLWQALQPEDLLSYKKANTYIPQITWSDNSTNTKIEYATSFRGCGSSGANEYAKNLTDNDITELGKDKNGTIVYGFKSSTNALLQIHYKEYLKFYTKAIYGDSYKPALGKRSAENFLKLRPAIIVKDKLGKYEVRSDTLFTEPGGCGKPVVYLYPTETTNVSVKVGADIVKSVPAYGNGWYVTAQPNGSLLHKGKTYDSLFWEGYGHGLYPDISQGSVVPRSQVEATLRHDLKAQGLNAKESADFLEFWLPKMPKTPYARLTWFGNNSLDRLAPLSISPAPQTVIRVFLDAEGLDTPIASLAKQKFFAPERKGFTVVEWGGLLNGKIQ